MRPISHFYLRVFAFTLDNVSDFFPYEDLAKIKSQFVDSRLSAGL